jgi:hypothetical protein
MRKMKSNLPLLLLAGVLTVAASAPVAMRVEVQPQRADGAGTLIVVVIQVSPEDRTRIGDSAMVRIEIDGDTPSGQSPLWAISLENDGSAEIETTWPPGEHDLRVEIASPSGKDTGLWVGKVRVPEFGVSEEVSTTPVRATPVPEPAPEPDRGVASGIAGGAAVAASVPEVAAAPPPPDDPVPPPVVVTDEVGEGGELPAEPERSEIDPQEETLEPAEPELQPAAEESTLAEPDLDPETAETVPAEETPAPPEIEPEAEEPAPVQTEIAPAVAAAGTAATASTEVTQAPKFDEPAPASEATAPPELPSVVEPLRSEEPPPSVEPLRSDSVTPTSVAPVAQPTGPSAEILEAYEEWGDADPETTDLTVVVMRSRQPVPDLDPGGLELRVGGSRVPIAEVGDADRAPLLLGIAVDFSDENVGRWGQVSRDLTPLAERAGHGLGRLFVATTGDETDWDVDPERMGEAMMTPAGGDVAALIRTSLGKFADRRGRTFLLVLTDGRIEPSKDAWRETTAAVEAAGIPVLVMALWDDGFRKKLRKNLQQITSMSGGRLFMLQALDQIDGAVERFGGVLDAGVALRFEPPAAGKASSQVAVTAPDRTLDITAPKTIR